MPSKPASSPAVDTSWCPLRHFSSATEPVDSARSHRLRAGSPRLPPPPTPQRPTASPRCSLCASDLPATNQVPQAVVKLLSSSKVSGEGCAVRFIIKNITKDAAAEGRGGRYRRRGWERPGPSGTCSAVLPGLRSDAIIRVTFSPPLFPEVGERG